MLWFTVDCLSFTNGVSNFTFDGGGTFANRQGRLFSNPFGILGHASCRTDNVGGIKGDLSGECYNEVECVLKRGRFREYCGPPAVAGVCCVFSTSKCDSVVEERVAYFTNPSYPASDGAPRSCMLRIRPKPGTCWVRCCFCCCWVVVAVAAAVVAVVIIVAIVAAACLLLLLFCCYCCCCCYRGCSYYSACRLQSFVPASFCC